MRTAAFVLSLLAMAGTATAQTLDVYVIDVEGGNAVLFVSPSHESLLIDSGNAGAVAAPRDAGRIVDAMKAAGVQRIDHLITTHWHSDHYGGMAELASRVPIAEFIDHGPNVQPAPSTDAFLQDTYPKLYSRGKHIIAKPGDRIPVAGLDVRVLTSAGQTIQAPLPGAGKPNPYCAAFKPADNNAEDPQSVGVLVTFGKFRALHMGDATRNIEFALMCPSNRIGAVDVLLGLHHGQASSNSEVLVHAIHPRVAIMNNGTRKGGEAETMKIVHSSPGLEDLWQLHFTAASGQEYNVPGMFIANSGEDPAVAHNGAAFWIKLSARQDGSFTVTNARNGFSKTYASAERKASTSR